MNCDICHRSHHPQRLPFLCAVDARNRLYEGRVAHAQALLENDSLEQRIDSFLSNSSSVARESPSSSKILAENLKSQEQLAAGRTDEIIAQADRLKAEVEAARRDIEKRKKAIARKRSDLASASNGIAARRTRQLEEAERAIQMTKYKWNRSFENMAGTRGFLCMEAARLYGLRRFKKGNSTRYEIGGVEIVDMPGLNSASPEVLSTSLAHISHILMLASHYLAIRLPAEITLPHRDYPRPTIFSLGSSYQHGEIPFPGTASLVPPSESRDRERPHVPRPRPLFIDKPLSTLVKEDPATYSLFIEGVVLLAYDIAWACCSQGVPVGDKSSYEDVCNMGKNLYNLLIGNQLHTNTAGRIFSSANSTPATNSNDEELGELGKATSLMGRYSHGTAHTFLGSADGNEFVRSFKLPNPIKLADRLKKKLVSEASIPEWEMLEDDAWAADDGMEEAVLVKGRKRGESDRRLFGVESMMTVQGALDATIAEGKAASGIDERSGTEKSKNAGTSGWTKLKTR
ncbi:UV radiation resistance protein autophagy-related protein 14 [Pleurostoma richardsiae]|uniref:Autophagy-related protein 14 n=1 Tax=Pleurostoma richardsiae TaxID=41990 RepID=A0AA38S0X9_9PEZI|nr:UV radiation resistance protein autophagy-related protein 14 [Pleurostoma richardsiae]